MLDDLKLLFDRDLLRLKKEIELFDGKNLWITSGEIKNSGGNLALHICGNLQHFVGYVLGRTDYKRDRTFEFSAKNLDKDYLGEEIENTRSALAATFNKLNLAEIQNQYPIEVLGYTMTSQHFLIHLYGHLNYHLGQVNYTRRLLLESA